MIIPVNKLYRINSDRYGWSIQRSKRRANGRQWEGILWFSSFENAVASLGNLMLRTDKARTLPEVHAAIERVTTTLSHAIPMEYCVRPKGACSCCRACVRSEEAGA